MSKFDKDLTREVGTGLLWATGIAAFVGCLMFAGFFLGERSKTQEYIRLTLILRNNEMPSEKIPTAIGQIWGEKQ